MEEHEEDDMETDEIDNNDNDEYETGKCEDSGDTSGNEEE